MDSPETSLEGLRLIYEKTPAMLHSIDRAYRIVLVSDRWLEVLGYRREEVEGRPLTDFLSDASRRKAIEEVLPAFFRTGQSSDVHYEMTHKRGDTLHVLLSATGLRDASGEVMRSLASMVDLTQQRATEQELAQTREALEYSQTINKTGSWRLDLVHDTVHWTPELFRILGLPVSPEVPSVEQQATLFAPESWSLLGAALGAAIGAGVPYELELQLAPSCNARWALARGQCQRNPEGTIIALVGTFQDVTEVVAARLEIAEATERIQFAQEVAGIGIWEWDPDADTLAWDTQMYQLFGIAEGQLVAYQDWRDAVHPEDFPRAERHLHQALVNHADFVSAFRIQHPSRGERHIRAIARMVDRLDGTRKLIGMNWDVTDQVAMEEDIRRSLNLESLGLLAGGIAHDFNNILAGLLGGVELLLLEEQHDEEALETLHEMETAIGSATRLTTQLLTFSKGGAPIKESTSLTELVAEQARFSLHGSTTRLTLDLASDLPLVDIDVGQIGQVIRNLVLNASQAMPGGGVLRVEARLVSNPTLLPERLPLGAYVKLVFEDSGEGIEEGTLPKIWNPYFSTKPSGHGLGLSIVRSIITRHQGHIEVSSTPGVGTRFILYLPSSKPPPPDTPSDQTIQPQGRGRVLFSDDDATVRRIIRRMMQSLGYEVTSCDAIDDAVGLFKESLDAGPRFDLVVTDLTIPGTGGGVELRQRVHALDPHIPVVVISGYSQDEILSNPTAHGFVGGLVKPISVHALSILLAQHCAPR